jgi:hypothetical protein
MYLCTGIGDIPVTALTLFPNVNTSVKDMENSQRIYGKNLGNTQGKTVRLHSDAITTVYIEVPPDIMTLHQDTISHNNC